VAQLPKILDQQPEGDAVSRSERDRVFNRRHSPKVREFIKEEEWANLGPPSRAHGAS
jgi:hypothetical protein